MLQGKKIYVLFALIMKFAIANSFGQITPDSLGVGGISFDYPQCPDTAFEVQSYDSIAVLVHNFRDTTFNGPIAIVFRAHDGQGIYQPMDTLIKFVGGLTYTIPANTSINLFLPNSYNFTPASYRNGSNVVVVWPVVSLGVLGFTDSLQTCVYFVPLNSTNEFTEDDAISVFPNPAEDYLTINVSSQKLIEGVRIIDISGRVVLSPLWDDSQKIKVDMLSSGMYVLEITTKAKQKIRTQFVRR
jgi:hypothetical protein